MIHRLDSITFPVTLSWEAHHLASQFAQHQHLPEKAQQVYLNTLAVYAVKFYLQCMEIETNLEASDSWNPVMQTLMDVADLEIPNLGKLECRSVLYSSQVVEIPAEVWDDRIGYLAVQFDEAQKEAKILGFVEKVATEELPLSKLRSLEEFINYLETLNPVHSIVQLNQWLQNTFEAGWQTVEALLGTSSEKLAYRWIKSNPLKDESIESVKRAKLIDLGLELGGKSVALLVAVAPTSEQTMNIRMQVYPAGEETYLPPNLKLALLSEAGETLRKVESRSLDNFIQLPRFICNPGERFSIQVALAHVSLTENFVV